MTATNTNTIDPAISYADLKVQAKDAISTIGKSVMSLTKTVGLYRAALTLKSPYYETDVAKASSQSFSLVEKWLIGAGLSKAAAKATTNNAKSPSVLAEKVLTLGLKESIYNAVSSDHCNQAAKAVTAETVDELNKIKPSKAGRLSKAAKDKFGIKPKAKVEDKPEAFVKPEADGDDAEPITEDKALFQCLNNLTAVGKIAKENLTDESRLALRKEVLALLNSLTPAIG